MINKTIYPRTPLILNDIDIKRQLEKPGDLPLDRLLYLHRYLNVVGKLNVNPEHAQRKAKELVRDFKMDPNHNQNMRMPPKPNNNGQAPKRNTASWVMDSFPRLRAKSVSYNSIPENETQIGVAKSVVTEGITQNLERLAYNRWQPVFKKNK